MKNELLMRAVEMLQREFGDDWQTIVQSLGTENLRRRVGKELTSFIAFPDRGCGGSNIWRKVCYGCKAVLRKKYFGFYAARPDVGQRYI